MKFSWTDLRRGTAARRNTATEATPSRPCDAARTIQRALEAAGLVPNSASKIPDSNGNGSAARDYGIKTRLGPNSRFSPGVLKPLSTSSVRPARRPALPDESEPGSFTTHSASVASGTRTYKLYVPASCSQQPESPVPLVMMLHGCTQSPDDFAQGTRMNALAEQYRFLVVYPAQSSSANISKCWNWFQEAHQMRDAGEPAILAAIVSDVAERHRLDTNSVFAAGLSAGGAMAVILGREYPDVFSAIGVHSGLPYASAHDIPSAFQAMHGHAPGPIPPNTARYRQLGGAAAPARVIVFQGDSDQTVNPVNAETIVADAVSRLSSSAPAVKQVMRSAEAQARPYVRTAYSDPDAVSRVEYWLVEGAGHAWMGGDAAGSYTDPSGPDASMQMVRFFLKHP